ncbi:MAG: UDP-N-acetylmuramate dehydrogenase [Candidatus Dormibacteria bacterium]
MEEPLARHVEFGIGGNAQWYWECDDVDRMGDAVQLCREKGMSLTVLGAGSNTLVSDAGLQGLVVKVIDKRIEVNGERGTISARAGVMMPRLALDAAKSGCSGLEFGIGIPGTVGGSVVGNAGAFGREICDVLMSCDIMLPTGERETLGRDTCQFAYRTSVFKKELKSAIVLQAVFAVSPGEPHALKEYIDSLSAERKSSQPYGKKSLGSTFKNPRGMKAGILLEQSHCKGMRIGGAHVSDKHANFIINDAHATAADVVNLVTQMHDAVFNETGVDLEPEIVMLGMSRTQEDAP